MDMDNAALIVGLILAIPLWRLYHKVFVVFYRDAFWGILGEIFGAIVTGYIIATIAFSVFGSVAAAIWTILEPVLMIAVFAASIYLLVMFLWVFKHRKRNTATGETSEPAYTGIAGSFYKTWNFLKRKGETAILLAVFIVFFGIFGICMRLGIIS